MTRRLDLELVLKKSVLFGSLTGKERQKMAALSHERMFDRGETIFEEGHPSDSVWLGMEGRVHLLHHLSDGRIQTTCVMSPGETFCCLPALDRGAYPATAVAATRVKVLQIPSGLFHEIIGKNPTMLKETLCVFGGRLRQVEAKGCMLHDPVECRIAQALLALQKKFGETIPLTKQEVADLVGTTVETAIRTISRFQKEGWVRSLRGKIQILNAEQLSRISS
jgi:CRP/FNR family transcriptional regulator